MKKLFILGAGGHACLGAKERAVRITDADKGLIKVGWRCLGMVKWLHMGHEGQGV